MNIALITPAKPGTRNGNRNTATRWAAMLRAEGHRVTIETEWSGAAADLMLALHARRSHASIRRYAEQFPQHPLVLALTGTDLYRDIQTDRDAQHSMQLATRMIVLQSEGLQELSEPLRAKTHVVYQSAQPGGRAPALRSCYEVCVIGHLREEKDPLRAALALRYLPQDSRIRITQLGRALADDLAHQAQQLMAADARYRWLGERPHWQVRKILGRAKLMVISSRMEGGANVISEALAARCPVVAAYVPGNIGMLGRDYVGYYPLGDERELARVLALAETDLAFYRQLHIQCASRHHLMRPIAERKALAAVIAACQRSSSGRTRSKR